MGGRGTGSSFNGSGRGGLLPESKGSSNDKQFDVSIFMGSKIKSLSGFEKLMQMNGLNMETAWLSDKDGNIVAGARGNSTSVGVAYPRELQKGLTLTHNHPGKYGGTFSTADISHLTRANLAEIRAVAKEGTYSLKATSNARPLDFNRALNKDYSRLQRLANQRYKQAQEQGKKGAEARKAYVDTISNWYKKNAKKYGYTYTTKAHTK